MTHSLPRSIHPTIVSIQRWFTDRDHWALLLMAGIYLFSILIHLNIPTTDLGLYNVVIPALALGILGIYRDLLAVVWQRHRHTLLLTLALYLWLWVSAFFGGYTATAVKYTIKYSVYFFVFPALLTLSFKWVRDRKGDWIYRFFWIFTLIAAIVGLIDYLAPELSLLTWIRGANPLRGSRIMSFFDNPTKLGVAMALGVLNAYGMGKLKMLKRQSLVTCLILGGSASLCGGAAVLSGSRNFLITVVLAMGLGIYPWRIVSKRELLVILAIGIMAIAIALNPSSTLSLRVWNTIQELPQNWLLLKQMLAGHEETINAISTPHRLRIWYAAVEQIRISPWFGTGMAGFTTNIMQGLNAHNLLLNLLVEIGIPGTAAFLGVLTSALWQTQLRDLRVGFMCSFIFTSQLFDFFVHDFTAVITMLWLLAAASQLKATQEQTAPS